LVFGRFGVPELDPSRLADPRVRRLQGAITLTEDPAFSRLFPGERWARVRITLADGRTLVSEPARARGNPENPLPDDEMRDKFRALAEPVLGPARTSRIDVLVQTLTDDDAALPALVDELLSGNPFGRPHNAPGAPR